MLFSLERAFPQFLCSLLAFFAVFNSAEGLRPSWAWMAHSDGTVNVPGVYGTKGIPDVSNYPGSRSDAVEWFDETRRELFLFGGNAFTTNNALAGMSLCLNERK